MILDGNDRVLEIRGDLFERDVAALLVEAKPGAAGRVMEHGVADAAIQLEDRPGVARRPDRRGDEKHHERGANQGDQPLADGEGANG
jgi:hypothetical protein